MMYIKNYLLIAGICSIKMKIMLVSLLDNRNIDKTFYSYELRQQATLKFNPDF